MRALLAITTMAALTACATAQPPTPRSVAQVAAFKRANPCPSTGQTRGSCPGYIVDHINALACGGPDTPANMQWQTVPEAKAKDRWERADCPPKRRATP